MKKFNIKGLLALVLCVTVVLSLSPCCLTASAESDLTAGLSVMEKKEGYVLVGEDGGLKLYLDTKTTNFYVEDSATGKKTYAFPENISEESTSPIQLIEMQAALVFTFWDREKKTENRKNTNALSVKQDNYTVYADENGFIIEYNLKSQQTTVYFSVKLENGKLYCTVPAGAIKEENPQKSTLLTISVLPFMVSGMGNTEGVIVLPDGCGEILDFSTTRANAAIYKKHIYGRDNSTTLSIESKDGYNITCPYLASITNGVGMLATPEKGAAIGYVNANPAGKSTEYANAYFSYDYRATDIAIIGDKQTMASQSTLVLDDEVYDKDITVSYSFIFDNPTLPTLAEKYGEYLVPEAKTSDDNSTLIDVYGFVNEAKSFLGFPYTAVSVLSAGDDIVALANNEKLGNITINLKNITKNQQKYHIDTNLKPLSKILNAKQLKSLNDSKAKVFVEADPLTFKKGTLSVNSFFSAAKTIYGAPIAMYQFRESTHMVNKNVSKSLLLKNAKIGNVMNKLTASANKLGLDGISSETLASILYHDYSSEGTLENTRADIEAAIEASHNKTDLILAAPFDYAIKYCSAITNIPVASSNNDMCSGSFPFLQLALGNRIAYSCEPINLNRSPETMFLRAVATGSDLHYSYILTDAEPIISTELNYLYSADFGTFKEMTESQCSAQKEIVSVTDGSALVDYIEKDDTITSKFENGTTLIVNLTQKTYEFVNQ